MAQYPRGSDAASDGEMEAFWQQMEFEGDNTEPTRMQAVVNFLKWIWGKVKEAVAWLEDWSE